MTVPSRGGARPGSGRIPKSAFTISSDSLPLLEPSQYELPHEFMLRHMNDHNVSLELRLRIAQALLPYYAVQERHKGVKARRQELADLIVDDRFTVRRTPS